MMNRYRLWKISRRAKPDAAFETCLRRTLAERGAFATGVRTAPAWRFATAVCVFALMFSVGTSAYAYSSDEVLPDHTLYPLREYVEGVEERVVSKVEIKDVIRRKHLERKLKEIRRMQERRSLIEDRLLERVERVLESGLDERRPSSEIREDVMREIRAIDAQELPLKVRIQIQRIQTRFERMEGIGR
ncbi:MAG: hypothetical protein AAB668_02670 [Patescibacteria group bacterium]